MSEAPLILGVSGLRGVVGESLTPELASRYAATFGAWLLEREGSPCKVMVASDGRAGGESIYDAAAAGLASAGCDVIRLGVQSTPTAGWAVDNEPADGAIQVTASHNPQEWNGLKCLVCEPIDRQAYLLAEGLEPGSGRAVIAQTVAGARAPSAGEAEEIVSRFRNGAPVAAESPGTISDSAESVERSHAFEVVSCLGTVIGQATKDRKAHAVLDSVNASGASGAQALLERLECKVDQIAGDGSGLFPHTPEPTAENLAASGGLSDAVRALEADVGFAQDPDADRLAIIDENGLYIGEEYTLALCAMAALGADEVENAPDPDNPPGAPVLVANLSTSRMIDDVAHRYGAKVERTAVGEANVVARMKRVMADGRRVALGGEGNGGIIWPSVVFVRDSLSGMALVLALMATSGKSVSQLVKAIEAISTGGAGYTIVKRKVPIASKDDAAPAVDAVAGWAGGLGKDVRVDLQDGVRVDLDSGEWAGSWVHVRASNTEPIMRLICEAPTDEIAGAVLAAVEGAIGA